MKRPSPIQSGLGLMPRRRALIAKVHVGKKHLALEDDSYRALLARVTGKTSAADCDDAALERVLAEYRRLGWTETTGSRTTSQKPWVRKIYAIWADLKPLLDNADKDRLRAFVRRQTRSLKNPDGIGDPEWLDAQEATKVINGLEGWLNRARRAGSAAGDKGGDDAA